MKRLRRTLLNAATAMSLVLCAAAVTLWVRSYWVGDDLILNADGVRFALASERGHIQYNRHSYYLSVPADGWARASHPPTDGRLAGESFYIAPMGACREVVIRVPHWFACLATFGLAVPPFRLTQRRRHKAESGLSPACGYDLRATPGRCPECGNSPRASNAHGRRFRRVGRDRRVRRQRVAGGPAWR